MKAPGTQAGGFTLIELAVVAALIGLVSAVALPQFFPIIASNRIEGSARHLANFGRAAMAHAVMMKDRLVIRIDLDAQEYYAVHWVLPPEVQEKIKADKEKKAKESGQSMHLRSTEIGKTHGPEEDALSEEDLQMGESFDKMARDDLEARCKNVKRDDMMDEVQIKFSKFTLDSSSEEQEPVEEEVTLPLLERTKLNEDTQIDSVIVGSDASSGGIVEIEIPSSGLQQPVVIYVKSGDETYTIAWDPITASGQWFEGKESFS